MKNLHDGSGLRELKRPLYRIVHRRRPAFSQSLHGEIEDLKPSDEDGPVVEGEVDPSESGEETGHGKSEVGWG